MYLSKFRFFLQLTLFVSILAMSSCTREYVQNANPVCFEDEVLPIFQSNCTQSGCHNAQDKRDGYVLVDYANITSKGIEPGNYKDSKIYQSLISNREPMPKDPYDRLTDAQITTIALWIEEGAQNTTCASTSCDTTLVTYASTVKPIITDYCLGCHSGSAPSANISYETFAGVKATVTNGTFWGSINHDAGFSPMPKNANKLSTCQLNKIKKWINDGALDN